MSAPQFALYKDPDRINDVPGTLVRRMSNFNEEQLFSSNLNAEDYDTVMSVMKRLVSTVGVNGVEFKTPSGKIYYLEQLTTS